MTTNFHSFRGVNKWKRMGRGLHPLRYRRLAKDPGKPARPLERSTSTSTSAPSKPTTAQLRTFASINHMPPQLLLKRIMHEERQKYNMFDQMYYAHIWAPLVAAYFTLTRMRLGTRATIASVARMQARPPLTTENSGVKNPATKPDSN
jgi:hypothetical protein